MESTPPIDLVSVSESNPEGAGSTDFFHGKNGFTTDTVTLYEGDCLNREFAMTNPTFHLLAETLWGRPRCLCVSTDAGVCLDLVRSILRTRLLRLFFHSFRTCMPICCRHWLDALGAPDIALVKTSCYSENPIHRAIAILYPSQRMGSPQSFSPK